MYDISVILFLVAMLFISFGVIKSDALDKFINKKISAIAGLVLSIIAALILVFAEAITTSPESIETIQNGTFLVTRIIDGDTIELENGIKIRYIGIDTPETVAPNKETECFGKEASNKNADLVLNKQVTLEKDVSETDKYGRLLRYVYIDDLFVNDYLVRQGFANASSYPPDIKYQDQFRQAEEEARNNNLGLWNVCPI